MIEHTTYTCEICGKEYDDRDEAVRDEASHYNLTTHEYYEWELLYDNLSRAIDLKTLRETGTDTIYDSILELLSKFEKEHNLTNRKRPHGFAC